MTYYRHNARGVSLIEVMGAVLVFMVGVTAMISVFIASMRMSKESGYAYNAFNISKKHMETLRAMDFSLLAAANETDTVLDANGDGDPDGEYRRSTTVTTPYNGQADLASVTISVNYTSHGQVNQTPMLLTTVILDT